MMYIDPKDQPAHPDWNPTYRAAWDERRKLRLEHFDISKRIEQMDMFLAMYEKLEPQAPSSAPQVTATTAQASGCNSTVSKSFV